MKPFLFSLIALIAPASCWTELQGYVFAVYLHDESQFGFKLYCGDLNGYGSAIEEAPAGNNFFVVSADEVGATLYDKMHAQLLSALNNKRRVWITYDGANHVVATTVYNWDRWAQPDELCP